MEKSGKFLQNCEADLEKLGFRYSGDYSSICLWYLEKYNDIIPV